MICKVGIISHHILITRFHFTYFSQNFSLKDVGFCIKVLVPYINTLSATGQAVLQREIRISIDRSSGDLNVYY